MMLLQLHPQPVRELAAHHRLTHPGHCLKGLAGTHQIKREKVPDSRGATLARKVSALLWLTSP